MDGKVLKRGWLKKQGGLVRNWQDRWFVLQGTSLLYYTRDDESRQQGHISLLGWTVCELPYNRDEPDRWMFEVNQGSCKGGKNGEHFTLWASTEQLRTEWVSAIRRAIYHEIGGGVFGGPLLDIIRYDMRFYKLEVPHVIKQCVERIRSDGMEVEGIFRLSGRLAQVKEMRRRYDEGERPDFSEECVDVHTAASLLKLYFRELPEPIIPFEHFEAFLNLATSFRYNSNHDATFKSLKTLVRSIPPENYTLLKYITSFLFEISKYQHVNKMTEKNIATIFGTNILRSEDDTPEFQMATQNLTTQVVLAFVTWHDKVFNDAAEAEQDITVDKTEMEQLVNISDNAELSSISDTDSLTASTNESNVVGDLLGVDFNNMNVNGGSNGPSSAVKVPPPIPARANERPDTLVGLAVPNTLANGDLISPASEQFVSAPESPNDSPAEQPTPTPRIKITGDETVAESEQQGANIRRLANESNTNNKQQKANIRRHVGGSLRSRGRPTAVVSERSPSPPVPVGKTDTPLTRLDRTASNFTSFIDSPLDERVSLNIGDLPSTVDDLQALALSLKLQLKEKNQVILKLEQQVTSQTVKHQEQTAALAQKIYQERESRDHAVARVVELSSKLAIYQSKYGPLE